MLKHTLFAFMLFMLGGPIYADDVKTRILSQPDSLPASPIDDDGLEADTLSSAEADSMSLERLKALYHNLNSVTKSDTNTWTGRVQLALDSLCNTGIFETSQLGLYVYDLTADADIFAVNHLHRMRPASCEKLVTAISGLNYLGGNYKLRTELRISGEVVDSVLNGDVYVIGCMDPMLSQGEVYQLAKSLKDEGIDSIKGRVYTDISFKDSDDYGWGWCWDDKYGPLRVLTVDGKDKFAEEFVGDIKSLGIVLINEEVGIQKCPGSTKQLKVVQHTIDQLLQRMMKNSNNIYAESMFYHLAAHSGASGSGRRQAVGYINSLITKLGLRPAHYIIADGSGLSLYNYLTPQLLVRMLAYAWKDNSIRAHLYPSLPIAGVDGTLSRRMRGTKAYNNVHAKTGTVRGVSSLSGYATSTEGHVIVFSIINQGVMSTETGREFQNKVCRILCEQEVPKVEEPTIDSQDGIEGEKH